MFLKLNESVVFSAALVPRRSPEGRLFDRDYVWYVYTVFKEKEKVSQGNIQTFIPDNNVNGEASVPTEDDMNIFINKHACWPTMSPRQTKHLKVCSLLDLF